MYRRVVVLAVAVNIHCGKFEMRGERSGSYDPEALSTPDFCTQHAGQLAQQKCAAVGVTLGVLR